MPPKFSCITATYNQLPFLKKAKRDWEQQTIKDFEWILAIDGSTDGTWEWAKENKIKAVKGRGNYDWSIYNKAAKIADGEYLTWVMGDSYPKDDYLEQLLILLRPERVVNGIRINVDKGGQFVSKDWRVGRITEEVDAIKTTWDKMTLNSLAMPKKLYEEIGGMYEKYRGYGRADYDLIIRASRAGATMWCAPRAIIYHIDHPGRIADSPGNIRLFEKRFPGV